ncbi:spore germination protein [Clostridium brassicae]|uniref:Spore germination protein n=1 Tax=Clostridium brassicae TaxID=2999072 RepID=A0ABT4DBQ0_9CLOT|nr:spore germination protein [Clostridium brassicae]MCY6959730.1 spore germination protein [Clostridium brassicae]
MNAQYISHIKEKLKDSFDVKYRELECPEGIITIIYIDNLCDSKFISEYVIQPLLSNKDLKDIDSIKKEILWANIVGNVNDENDAISHILSGDIVLVFNFDKNILYCEAKGFAKRPVFVPPTEAVIKGPREGFNEAIMDNISLVRRKIKNKDLKFESFSVGEKSQTIVVVSYIKGTAHDELVQYIRDKIKSIKIDFVLDTNYIEEQLKNTRSPFDTIGYTEKPDIVASKLFEGKVIVMVDGTPSVIVAPYFFIENLQAADDYYLNKYFTSFARLQRWIALFIAMLLPGLYIALSTYHFSLVPTVLVFRLANSRAGVPFPTIVEVVIMILFFQILREAGIRLPQPTGQALSIVGALILGEAAIGAGLTSETTIVIVAISSISTFLVPNLYKAVVIWSLIILLFSSLLGLPGFYLAFFSLIAHLASLDSCGYPYLYPVGTKSNNTNGDTLIRRGLNKISNNTFDEDEKNEKNS